MMFPRESQIEPERARESQREPERARDRHRESQREPEPESSQSFVIIVTPQTRGW